MPKPEIYVSTDIETDGPLMGKNSMLSLASAAFLADKTLVATFTVNLELLPEGESNPITMKFWEEFPEAWAHGRKDCVAPAVAMPRYVEWVKQLPGMPIFVARPAGFDFSFIKYYLDRFANENPFGYSVIDMRSYFMGMKGSLFMQTLKKDWPVHWHDDYPHTHIALDDALEQGALFCNMLAANTR